MSINFENELNEEQFKRVRGLAKKMGEIVDADQNTILLRKMEPITQKQGGDIARAAQQVATLELNSSGDTKVIRGCPYVMTETGWDKQIPDSQ